MQEQTSFLGSLWKRNVFGKGPSAVVTGQLGPENNPGVVYLSFNLFSCQILYHKSKVGFQNSQIPSCGKSRGRGDLHVCATASWDSLSCFVTVLSELRVLGEEGGLYKG